MTYEVSPSSPELVVEPTTLWTPTTLRQLGHRTAILLSSVRPDGEPNQLAILNELEPTVASEIDRHNSQRTAWYPADFFPIDQETGKIINRASDLKDAGEQPLLTPEAQAAMIVNLLTEDNLPAYHRVIADNFGLDGPWGTWVHKWTAEEGRHAYAMRVFLDLTEAVDTHQLEEARMTQVEQGYDGREKDPLHALAYVSFQELATRVSHRNTGKACDDPLADAMLARISTDENLHMVFYSNLVKAALDIAPNQMMRAITDEVMNFVMPGSNIKGFQTKALIIANAGIYDLRKHRDEVVMPILKRRWKIFDRAFGPEGEEARNELVRFLDQLGVSASRFEDRRHSGLFDKLIARAQANETPSSS